MAIVQLSHPLGQCLGSVCFCFCLYPFNEKTLQNPPLQYLLYIFVFIRTSNRLFSIQGPSFFFSFFLPHCCFPIFSSLLSVSRLFLCSYSLPVIIASATHLSSFSLLLVTSSLLSGHVNLSQHWSYFNFVPQNLMAPNGILSGREFWYFHFRPYYNVLSQSFLSS